AVLRRPPGAAHPRFRRGLPRRRRVGRRVVPLGARAAKRGVRLPAGSRGGAPVAAGIAGRGELRRVLPADVLLPGTSGRRDLDRRRSAPRDVRAPARQRPGHGGGARAGGRPRPVARAAARAPQLRPGRPRESFRGWCARGRPAVRFADHRLILGMACVLAAMPILFPSAVRAQVFIAARPVPGFAIGPLTLRASVAEGGGPVALDVLWSIVLPANRTASELAQDLYLLWPGEVRGEATPGKPDPVLARYVEERGFDIVGEGRLPLVALRLAEGTGGAGRGPGGGRRGRGGGAHLRSSSPRAGGRGGGARPPRSSGFRGAAASPTARG